MEANIQGMLLLMHTFWAYPLIALFGCLQALQLLEFLIKNGSERVVDDARSHMPLLRMLRQFHYIDQNGKDQGINVRNRSQELVKLLGDVDAIRAERKKARANRNKFGGIEGGMSIGGSFSGSNSRYGGGGFGSDITSFGGYSGGVYGDGGGFGGNTPEFRDTGRRGSRFEEYDEDEENTSTGREYGSASPRSKRESKAPEPPKAPEPDLFNLGDDDVVPTKPSSTVTGKQPVTATKNGLDMLQDTAADDDDFNDFQSATPATRALPPPPSQFPPILSPASTSMNSSTPLVAPKPVSGTQGANLNDLVSFSSLSLTPNSNTVASSRSPSAPLVSSPVQPQQKQQQVKPSGYQAATPNYFTSVSVSPAQTSSPTTRPGLATPSSFSSTTSTTAISSAATNKPGTAKPSVGSGDAFGSLWSTASANAGIQKPSTATNKGSNLASMAKEKSSAGIWGMPAPSASASTLGFGSPPQQQHQQAGQKSSSSAFDDLLG
jgi:epsin